MAGLELPLLGEPMPIELANTWYVAGDEVIDFLDGPSSAAAWREWFAHVVPSAGFEAAFTGSDQVRLRNLRNAVRVLIEARIDGSTPPRDAIDVVNSAAGGAAPIVQLRWSGDEPAAAAAPRSSRADDVLGFLATASIELLAGTTRDDLRRCAADDCSMLFVRRHRRRRFCHESCSHRKRQARYADRQRKAEK